MKKVVEILFERFERAKSNGKICSDYWKKLSILRDNYSEVECWKMLTENIEWMLNAKSHFNLDFDILTSSELSNWFSIFELEAHNIFIEGNITINNGFAIGLCDVKIKATGHSRIVLFDHATADCYDTSFVSGFNNSSFVVNDCIGNAFHNCKAEAKGISIIETWSTNKAIKGNQSLIVERS